MVLGDGGDGDSCGGSVDQGLVWMGGWMGKWVWGEIIELGTRGMNQAAATYGVGAMPS